MPGMQDRPRVKTEGKTVPECEGRGFRYDEIVLINSAMYLRREWGTQGHNDEVDEKGRQ